MLSIAIPTEISDPVHARIRSISEDRLAGFVEHLFRDIAELADVAEEVVHERLAAMRRAGTIRRIRQTLMATNLAPGSVYRLWTTLKVPRRFSMQKHCELLAERTGAEAFRIMPAKRLFVLAVGHMRRRGMPGSKTDEPGQVIESVVADLSYLDWQVLGPLKRELAAEEIDPESMRSGAD